jgi:tetratricopeptide (TPR) repeat protein
MIRQLRPAIVLLALTFLSWTEARASDSWIQVTSPHFTVVSNAGEKEAKRIANQFEAIRGVFHLIFPAMRVDSGKPLTVIAVKNEESMKTFLPDFWAGKDRARPAGIFVSGFDENFAVLRTDVTGSAENSYHSLYHEYTHSILRLNFASLPVWLDEGLAEFYGNTVITDKELQVGMPSSRQVNLLRKSNFIPLDQLLTADRRSPFYNEQDQASIFYAESWALVHFLSLDPEARKEKYLTQYLHEWDETRDAEEAARRAFKDLKKFQSRLDDYLRQPAFQIYHGKLEEKASTELTVRSISPAEALVVQADFFQHYGHAADARRVLKQALDLEPNLASVHEGLGFDNYAQYNNDDAEKEFKQAAQLNPQDFRPYFYLAEINYRRNHYRAESTVQIIGYLEKAAQLNPNFAPTYAFLSVAYRQQRETREKALEAAMKANHLDPSILAYVADVGDALIALNRDAEARAIGDKLTKAARSPQEKSVAQQYALRLARHEEIIAGKKGSNPPSQEPDSGSILQDAPESNQPTAAATAGADRGKIASEEGLIREVDCNSSRGATIKFAILGETLLLSVTDLTKIEYRARGTNSTADAQPCSQWKGHKAKITYKAGETGTPGGEVTVIDFF